MTTKRETTATGNQSEKERIELEELKKAELEKAKKEKAEFEKVESELAERGRALSSKIKLEKVPPVVKTKHQLKCEEIVNEYAPHYPENLEFHITSDYQVFLSRDASYAQMHQKTLHGGEVLTIKID